MLNNPLNSAILLNMIKIKLFLLTAIIFSLFFAGESRSQESQNYTTTKPEAASEPAKPSVDMSTLEYKIFDGPKLEEGVNPPPYKKIGIALFGNQSRVWQGDKQFSLMLLGYAGTRFKNIEFVKVSRFSNPDSTMMFDEAKRLGETYGVDAIITGVLDKVSFPGGMFPMKSNNIPQGQGAAWFKLIETKNGFPVLDCYVWDENTVWYHPRIGEQRELENAIMKHVSEMISNVLQDEGFIFGETPNDRRKAEYRKAYIRLIDKRGKKDNRKSIFGF